MGTKRFIITEDEVRNILTLYKEKNLIKEDVFNTTKTKIWDWCARPENKKIRKSNSEVYSKIAGVLFGAITTAGGTNETGIKQALNTITYCGDLMGVKSEYENMYGSDLWDDLYGEIDIDNTWAVYVNAPLYTIKQRTEKQIKTLESYKKPDFIRQKCPVLKTTKYRGFYIVPEAKYNNVKNNNNFVREKVWCEEINKNIFLVKQKPPTPTPTPAPDLGGGGNPQPIGLDNTNMKNDDNRYWIVLYKKLVESNLTPNTNGVRPDEATGFTINKITINRDTQPFISYKINSTKSITGEIVDSSFSPIKYGGEDLNSVSLWLTNDPKNRQSLTLAQFLGVARSTQQQSATNDNESNPRVTPRIVYTTCTGEYRRNCKSETIRKVQGCLKSRYGLATDGKFGRHTENAIYRELGRRSFTDSDVTRLCATNQQTPTNQPQTPTNQPQTPTNQPQTPESGTQTQTYSGDEYSG